MLFYPKVLIAIIKLSLFDFYFGTSNLVFFFEINYTALLKILYTLNLSM